MVAFEGIETPGRSAVNFLHFSCNFVLSAMKILCIEVYCIPTNKVNGRYNVLRTCHIQQVKLDCLTKVTTFSYIHAERAGGVRVTHLPLNLPRSIGN